MNLNIDLTKIRDPRKGVFNEIAIGPYSIASVDGNLVIKNGEKIIAEIEESEACLKLTDLAIGGRELAALGFEPSPEMGRVLNTLLDEVMEEKVIFVIIMLHVIYYIIEVIEKVVELRKR